MSVAEETVQAYEGVGSILGVAIIGSGIAAAAEAAFIVAIREISVKIIEGGIIVPALVNAAKYSAHRSLDLASGGITLLWCNSFSSIFQP